MTRPLIRLVCATVIALAGTATATASAQAEDCSTSFSCGFDANVENTVTLSPEQAEFNSSASTASCQANPPAGWPAGFPVPGCTFG